MTGRKLPKGCHRQGSKMIAHVHSCWPMLISAITFSLLSSGFTVIDAEAATNSYVVANVNSNHHQASVTSPPFVSAAAEAAAAAALGGIDVGRSLVTALLGSPATSTSAPKAYQAVAKINAAPERAVSVQQKQKQAGPAQQVVTTVTIAAQTTTKPPAVAVKASATSTPPPLTFTIAHKHSGKVINVSDTLHKFDLYLDPVCDQINKLTSKQLSKVYVQLKQFSQKNNDALARCFNGLGFRLDLSADQQQTRQNRDNLANVCSARSLANEPYKQFSACAAKSWSKTMDVEIDHALRDRLRGNKATASSKSSSQQLTSAEMSLIDDIVAQLQEGQVAEITTELGGEQQHSSVSSTSSKTSESKEATANKVVTIQQVAGENSHRSSDKSETKVSSGTSSGKQFHLKSTPPSGAVVLSKSLENLSVNEHNAQKAVPTTTTTTSTKSSTTSFQAPSQGTNLEKDFKVNVVGAGQSANNVKLTLITTIAPSSTPLNGPTTDTGNKVQLSIVSINKQPTTSGPPATSVVFIEDAKKSAQTNQAGSSIKVVEEHKSQPVNLLNGGNSIKLAADDASAQILASNQQNSQADRQAKALVNNLKPLPPPPPPTSSPPPPAVIPAPPTQPTFAVEQKIGSGPPLPPVLVPAQVPSPAVVPIANQVPPPLPPPPTISPLANMILNSMSLTTIGPLANRADSASAASTNSLNPPPALAANNFNGVGSNASAASSAGGSQNRPFNTGRSAASTVSAVNPAGPAPSPAAPINPPTVAQPPQGPPPIAPTAANSAAEAATFQPPPPAGASGGISAQHIPLTPQPSPPLPPPPPPPPLPSPLPPAPPMANGSGAAVAATVSADKGRSDLSHSDQQLASPIGLAAVSPTASAAIAAGTASASAKNAIGEIAIAQAPAGPVGVKMEHAMLKNVDKALDVLNNAVSIATTTTIKPEKSNKLLEMIGSAVVNNTLDRTASTSGDKVAAIVIRATTTRAPISVIIIDKNDQEDEMKQKSQTTSEKSSTVVTGKSHHHDGESVELTSAHDVIVVGEHVEGDDLIHDNEDHSQHLHEHKSDESIVSSSHHEHDESDSKAKIEHTNQSSEVKTTTTTTSTTTSVSDSREEDHSDHEHLIEDLKDGDVIHVEAAELEGHEGGN